MCRRHAISPGFSGHFQYLDISSLKMHDLACNVILSVDRLAHVAGRLTGECNGQEPVICVFQKETLNTFTQANTTVALTQKEYSGGADPHNLGWKSTAKDPPSPSYVHYWYLLGISTVFLRRSSLYLPWMS